MREEERKRVLGQWGVRVASPRERAEQAALERNLQGHELKGRRVPLRPHPFGRAVDSYVVSAGGPLPYMRRLREIDEQTAGHERALRDAWRGLARESDDATAFAVRWRGIAGRWSFAEVNELIARHNRYYPAEAGLPMDVARRDFALVNGEPYWKRPLGETWILERFPPVLTSALAGGA